MFNAGFEVCKACEMLERAQHEQAKNDEPAAKNNKFVASISRMWQVIKLN